MIFYQADYLLENDRVRYTILPDAGKEVLKRPLKLNHEIHEQEVKAGLHGKGKSKKKQKADASEQMKLFEKHIKSGIGPKVSLSYDVIQPLYNTTKL
jgi:DNA-binding transcriptional regulator YiaG